MSDNHLLGPWISRLLMEHPVSERNMSRNTQISYRDTLTLLIPFITGKIGKPVERLALEHQTPYVVSGFLAHLKRGGSQRN